MFKMKIDNETFDNYYNNKFKFQKNIYKKIGILGHRIVPFRTELVEKTYQSNQNQPQPQPQPPPQPQLQGDNQENSAEKSNDFINKLLPLIESNNIKPNTLIETRFDISEVSLTNESFTSANTNKNTSIFTVRPPSINELRNQLNTNQNNSSETNIVYQLSRIHLNKKHLRSKHLARSLSTSLLNNDEKEQSEALINSIDVDQTSDD
jgi:hypothetical protein